MVLLSACETPLPTPPPPLPSATQTDQATLIFPTPTIATPTPLPTHTATPGPSPTSTSLPELASQAWVAKPVMVEAARIGQDDLAPFYYTPFFLLYGDGLLVKRTCQDGDCRYLQAQLDQTALCRLVNAIDRTGFLNADSSAFTIPGGSGALIRLNVDIYSTKLAEIPDLDRWANTPLWYESFTGCVGCFTPPSIDPAFIDLYRLLTTYADQEMTGFATDRLAVWLAKPIIAGQAKPWSPDLISLTELAERSACPGDPSRQNAVILEGSSARMLSNFLSQGEESAPLFIENGITWQVHSRWLLPYEMPQTCDKEPGLYPPAGTLAVNWNCNASFGAIPTPTPTITPTVTLTPTPLR